MVVVPAESVTAQADDLKAPRSVRARLVRIDLSRLPDSAAGRPVLRFELFPDAEFEGPLDEIVGEEGSRTWSGSLAGKAGYFDISESGGVVLVHVGTKKHGVFEASLLRDDIYRVIQVGQPTGG